MKKIFYILASAIVALGAIACENEGLENVAPEVNGTETLSFTATIDNTKTNLDGLKTIWVKGDVVMINTYKFVCQEDLATFTCTGLTKEQVANLKAAEKLTATYSKNNDGKVDSAAGVAGAVLKAEGNFNKGFNFSVKSAMLKFQVPAFAETIWGVEFWNNANSNASIGKCEQTFAAGTTYYMAVDPGTYTVTSRINGYLSKKGTTANTLKEGGLYDLGTLTAPQKASWNIKGGFVGGNGWGADVPLYKYDENGNQCITKVDFGTSGNEFKFYNASNGWSGYDSNSMADSANGWYWIKGNSGGNIPAKGVVDIYVNDSGWAFKIVEHGVYPF